MTTESQDTGLEMDEVMGAMCRLRSHIPRTAESKAVMSFLDDLCREQPRGGKNPLGWLPKIVDVGGRARAPWHVLWAPVNHLKGQAFNKYYMTSLPCIVELTARETEANNLLNHAQHRVLKSPYEDALDAAIEAADVQIAETRFYRARLVHMKQNKRAD